MSRRKRRGEKALTRKRHKAVIQRRAARLSSPLTLRKVRDPKPDQPDEQEQE